MGYPPRIGQLRIDDADGPDNEHAFIQMSVVPISERYSFDHWGCFVPAVMVLHHSLEEHESFLTPEAILRHGYGCTPAEARVVSLRVQGYDYIDIERKLAISANTIRQYTQRVRRKTSAATLMELYGLLKEHAPPLLASSLSLLPEAESDSMFS